MKNNNPIIIGGTEFNLNPEKIDLNYLDLVKIFNELDYVFHQVALPGALGSKAKRHSVPGVCGCQDRKVGAQDAWMGDERRVYLYRREYSGSTACGWGFSFGRGVGLGFVNMGLGRES